MGLEKGGGEMAERESPRNGEAHKKNFLPLSGDRARREINVPK